MDKTSFTLTPAEWRTFTETYWQKQPVVLRKALLMDPAEVFATLVAACDLYRAKAANAPLLKLYVNSKQVSHNLGAYLPDERDGSPAEYDARLQRELNAESFILFVPGFEGYNATLYDRGRAFFNGLFERVGIPAGHVELELFLGRYSYTPGGIHNEECTNFQWVIDGNKTMHTWPEATWNPETLAVTKQQEPTSHEQEQFLDEVRVEDHRGQSLALNGDPGDILYWPSRFWHVGETPELSMSITGALYMAGAPYDLISDALAATVEQRLGSARRAPAYPIKPLTGAQEDAVLPPSITRAVQAVYDLRQDDTFSSAIIQQWLRRQTSLSFSKIPPQSPAAALDDTAWVQLSHNLPINWVQQGDQLFYAASGYCSATQAQPCVIAMLQQLNTGAAVQVRDLVASGSAGDAALLKTTLDELHGMRAINRVSAPHALS